ncbi:hypothetical protein [Caulobacter sp. B11]|uniref:hypothetical protein n=1 Tax=Caulobacter sp. B11 TaxID=2048899 RepID=UPI00117DB5A7|nr:hypothetical protein [Caulobacter sp. B11]
MHYVTHNTPPKDIKISISNSIIFGLLVSAFFWALAAALNNSNANTIAATVSAVIDVYLLYHLIKVGMFCVSLLKTGSLFLSLSLSFGWLISIIIHFFTLDYSIDYTLQLISINAGQYAFGVLYASIFALSLGCLSISPILSRMEMRVALSIKSLRLTPTYIPVIFLIILSLLDLFLISSGIIGQRKFGISGQNVGEVEFYIPFLEMALGSQIALNSLALSRFNFKTELLSIKSLAIAVSLILTLFIYFSKGRTGLIFFAVMHFVWITFISGRLPRFKTLIIITAIGVPIYYNAMLASNMARNMRYDTRTGTEVSGLNVAIGSATALKDTNVRAQQARRTALNLSTRPLLAASLSASMQKANHDWKYLNGQYLVNSLIWTIPRALFPNKVDVENAEVLMASNGIVTGYSDVADSLYFAGYVDFGWFGLIIYPIIIYTIAFFILFMCEILGPAFSLVTLSSAIYAFTFGMGEASVTGWLVMPRNMFLLFLIFPFGTFLFSHFSGRRGGKIRPRYGRRHVASPPR